MVYPLPLGGEGSRCARREARREGEGETILIITPTLILPRQGGGKFF